jgi:hypothetical protein
MNVLRQVLKAHRNFIGACRSCYSKQPKARKFRSKKNPAGRRFSSTGYVLLTQNAIAMEDMATFDIMRGKGGFISEHRWVMAKFLGRPLTSNEMVDHMDGNKQNNDLSNLRLYVRGKQQPGSCPGHGTYYHEWQMAERRVRELEALLAAR